MINDNMDGGIIILALIVVAFVLGTMGGVVLLIDNMDMYQTIP